MTNAILVAYATRYGSTKEVAEAVGAQLRTHGLTVDVKPVADVETLQGYGAVVLGAPIYIGALLKQMHAFLAQQRAALAQMPVAFFALGPLAADDGMAQAQAELDAALAQIDWLRPAAVQLFVGKYDPAHLRLADKLLTVLPASPLHSLPASDARDWDAIRAWADSVPAALRLPLPA